MTESKYTGQKTISIILELQARINLKPKKFNVQYDDGDLGDLILKNEIWKPAPKEIHFAEVLPQLSNKFQQHDKVMEQELKFARNSEDSGFFQESDLLQIVRNPIHSRLTAASKTEVEGLLSCGSYEVVRK